MFPMYITLELTGLNMTHSVSGAREFDFAQVKQVFIPVHVVSEPISGMEPRIACSRKAKGGIYA